MRTNSLGLRARIIDELERLAESFTRMLRRIHAGYKENMKLPDRVANFNRELQVEVERATWDLAARHEELRRAYADLFELQQQLSRTERLAMAGQLSAMVAHEIGTPLHSISGYVQLLLQESNLDREAMDRLRIIETQIARVVAILQTILAALSPLEPVLKPLDITQLVQGLLDLLAPVLSRKEVAVSTAFSPDLPFVVGDALQLQQVFLNLIANALAAMPHSGTLRLTSRRLACDQGPVVSQPQSFRPLTGRQPWTADADFVEILVADTGRGIPPEYLNQIFELFFSTEEMGKGTGLGLSICRRWDLLSGRGGKYRPLDPGQAASLSPGARDQKGGRDREPQAGRPDHRRHQSRFGGPGEGGEVPGSPLLSLECRLHSPASPPRAEGGPPSFGRAFPP